MSPCRDKPPCLLFTRCCVLFSSSRGEDIALIQSLCIKNDRRTGEGQDGCSKYTTKRVLAFLGRVSEWRKRFLSRWIALVFSFALDFPRLFLPTISSRRSPILLHPGNMLLGIVCCFVEKKLTCWPTFRPVFTCCRYTRILRVRKKRILRLKDLAALFVSFQPKTFYFAHSMLRNNEDDTRNTITERLSVPKSARDSRRGRINGRGVFPSKSLAAYLF